MNVLARIKQFLTYWVVKITHGMLTCGEADQFMVDYLEYRLDPEVRERFENHLENCICCKDFLAGYKRTIELARACAEPTVPTAGPRMPPALMEAIIAARKGVSRPS